MIVQTCSKQNFKEPRLTLQKIATRPSQNEIKKTNQKEGKNQSAKQDTRLGKSI